MSRIIDRRGFMKVAVSAGAGLGLAMGLGRVAAGKANDKIVVGVMGTGGRGTGLAKLFEQQPEVEVAYVCDVDKHRVDHAVAEVNQVNGRSPKAVTDFRHILDDKSVDALVIATCNHWHAPATILACAAGKHVYVEKPCSHNPREGELMVQAARQHQRQVQLGTQRRSWPKIAEAVEQVRGGVIGRAYYAQAWYTDNRPSIGRGKPAPVPDGLDYDLWQGPAPRRPFHDNYLHYKWHWFWHWGNGELGNNGVHMIDVCRWALQVDYPIHVTSAGGRYRFSDDQETPDTHVVTFQFDGRKSIKWEGLSCNRLPEETGLGDRKPGDRKPGDRRPEVVFHGENGSLAIMGGGYAVYDPKGHEISKVTGSGGDAEHIGNFIEVIRLGDRNLGKGNLGEGKTARLNAEIEEGYKSTLLCHLGNIAYRTGRALHCDPKNGHILHDKDAEMFWSREYEKGWEPKV